MVAPELPNRELSREQVSQTIQLLPSLVNTGLKKQETLTESELRKLLEDAIDMIKVDEEDHQPSAGASVGQGFAAMSGDIDDEEQDGKGYGALATRFWTTRIHLASRLFVEIHVNMNRWGYTKTHGDTLEYDA